MGVPKIMIFFAVIISAALYWATSNVCRYNFALEKRTNILNVVTDESKARELANYRAQILKDKKVTTVLLPGPPRELRPMFKKYVAAQLKKISSGKMNKFKEDNSLMTQQWVMEPKKKVKNIIDELGFKDLRIVDFYRIKIGD